MLLMSKDIKEKIDADSLYGEAQELDESVYFHTDQVLDLTVELLYLDGTVITGRVQELEKERLVWLGEDFDNLKLMFFTSPGHASKFIFQNDLQKLVIKKDENLICEKSIEPCCAIITNIKSDLLGETSCMLTLNYHHK